MPDFSMLPANTVVQLFSEPTAVSELQQLVTIALGQSNDAEGAAAYLLAWYETGLIEPSQDIRMKLNVKTVETVEAVAAFLGRLDKSPGEIGFGDELEAVRVINDKRKKNNE